ncbi:MAG: hydrogenase maturation protease [Candidatus Paceibacterota bacterium]|jgi:hydrogenase maturation protease|nr:hydrogenase maturation protease [Candidatus Paceibacterota bacterium]
MFNNILKHPLLHAGNHEIGASVGGSGGTNSRAIARKNIPMVEGKMSFEVIQRVDGKFDVNLIVEEPLRHFEAICEGKSWEEVPIIVSRICGVCPFPYALAASKGAERAFGIKVSDQTHRLREIALYGNMFNSHVLHALDLVLPRLLHVNSIIEFAVATPENTALAAKLLGLHTLGNDLARLVGGREVHSITITPGYMTAIPKTEELKAVRDRLANAHETYDVLVKVFADVSAGSNPKLPIREREFIALRGDTKYPFYGSLIGSSKRGTMTPEEFEQYKHEYVVDNSNSKQVHTDESDSYMVGALARLNINSDLICEEAKKDMETLGLSLPNYDPYMNTAAQLVEGRQVLIDAVKAIDELLAIGLKKEKRPRIVPREGYGAGYLEAPRGMIWHEYRYDKNGLVTWANCIIPTGMNTGSMQEDLEHFSEHLLGEAHASDEEIGYDLDLLLAHYDPCNSCAVHVVRLGSKNEPKITLARDAKVAVVSIGNTLAGDDAVGNVVVEEIKHHGVEGNVDYIHGGVSGLTILEDLAAEKYDAIYFIDAVDGLSRVGEVIKLTGEELLEKAQESEPALSLHQGDFTHAFRLARAVKLEVPEKVLFFGIQVGQTEVGMGLTAEIDTHEIAHAIIHEIEDDLYSK